LLAHKVDLWPSPFFSADRFHPHANQSSVAGKLSDFVDGLAGRIGMAGQLLFVGNS
jgi:hypothetical protein